MVVKIHPDLQEPLFDGIPEGMHVTAILRDPFMNEIYLIAAKQNPANSLRYDDRDCQRLYVGPQAALEEMKITPFRVYGSGGIDIPFRRGKIPANLRLRSEGDSVEYEGRVSIPLERLL